MKLLIASASNRPSCSSFIVSLLNLFNRLNKIGVNSQPCEVVMHLLANSSLLSAARQNAFNAAIKEGCSHLLMLDDDMTFPGEIVDMMASHDKDFVAANYVSKGLSGSPVAVGEGGKIFSAGKTGIEEIGWVGMGCVLIRMTEEIKAIPAPHFEVIWLEETQTYLGEDYYACEKLRKAGVHLYVDHDVSNKIGHVGEFRYTEDTLSLFSNLK